MMQILNLYAYVNNNPLIYTDPSGLFLIGIIIGGAIIGGAVAGANRPPSGGGSSGGNNPIPSMPPPGHNTGGSGSGSGGNNPIPSVPPPNLAVGGSGSNSGSQPSVSLSVGNIIGNLIANTINNAIARAVHAPAPPDPGVGGTSVQGAPTTIFLQTISGAFVESRGYIVNGRTVTASGSRIQDGTIVRTASGYYQMVNGSGVRVDRPSNVQRTTIQAASSSGAWFSPPEPTPFGTPNSSNSIGNQAVRIGTAHTESSSVPIVFNGATRVSHTASYTTINAPAAHINLHGGTLTQDRAMASLQGNVGVNVGNASAQIGGHIGGSLGASGGLGWRDNTAILSGQISPPLTITFGYSLERTSVIDANTQSVAGSGREVSIDMAEAAFRFLVVVGNLHPGTPSRVPVPGR